jgi:succinate dehydrogenase / fumarate reductase iron-sulfur subunit
MLSDRGIFMNSSQWNLVFKVFRKKNQSDAHFIEYEISADPDEYILDVIERIWAYHDRSLTFAHACHHATCGACGMRVNGKEILACITPIRDISKDGETVRVEPLRNFPIVSDLVVDMGMLYRRMEHVGHKALNFVEDEPFPRIVTDFEVKKDYYRLADCIECGLCISACPVAITDQEYLGPAVLAGAHQRGLKEDKSLLDLVDSEVGVWRCHSAFECTSVCPSNVEPAWRIMELRKWIIKERIKGLFR